MTHYTFISRARNEGHIDIVPDQGDLTSYSIDRRTGWFSDKSTARIQKHVEGRTYEVGEASVRSDRVTCNGRSIRLHGKMFSSSETFVAPNNQKYKWSMDGAHGAHLRADKESTDTNIASYTAEHGPFKKPDELTVYGEGEMMMDEVVATAVYMARKVALKKKRRTSVAGAVIEFLGDGLGG
ncbi:hypothetical protein OE88DRAFT_1663238 [Heliocybe sulcata]|uniref:DUF6593 domain-containing protein n=1 Tax=Heliocybe sulcata TaxID=5364 RepID=A0A5C3MYV2_9AGAM|nr:hypothetical protein OE88DRAFT_1663238 [Heliocybe sulcata]